MGNSNTVVINAYNITKKEFFKKECSISLIPSYRNDKEGYNDFISSFVLNLAPTWNDESDVLIWNGEELESIEERIVICKILRIESKIDAATFLFTQHCKGFRIIRKNTPTVFIDVSKFTEIPII